jgi:hypothetical protein
MNGIHMFDSSPSTDEIRRNLERRMSLTQPLPRPDLQLSRNLYKDGRHDVLAAFCLLALLIALGALLKYAPALLSLAR